MNDKDFQHGIYSIGVMTIFYCTTWVILTLCKLIGVL